MKERASRRVVRVVCSMPRDETKRQKDRRSNLCEKILLRQMFNVLLADLFWPFNFICCSLLSVDYGEDGKALFRNCSMRDLVTLINIDDTQVKFVGVRFCNLPGCAS